MTNIRLISYAGKIILFAQIDGFPKYFVSKCGKVWSENCFRVLKPARDGRGYNRIEVSKGDNNGIAHSVHRLVAIKYIPNPNNYPQVNHLDGNKDNNDISNLEWCTNQQNAKHAYDTGLWTIGEKLRQITRERSRKEIHCTVTGITYPSLWEAAEALGIGTSTIRRQIRGVSTNRLGLSYAA